MPACRRRLLRLLRRAGATLCAVAVVGCSSGAAPAAPPDPRAFLPDSAPTVPSTTVAPLPVHPVGWLACGALQCGWVDVPVDYDRPRGRTIAIAVARTPAGDPAARLGSLVINPGGPGGSGIDDLPTELRVLTPQLRAHFDIVSFDPRGVGRSAPISCAAPGAPPSPPDLLPNPVPQTAAERDALLAADRAYAASCLRYADAGVLAHMGTDNVARDLDRIREALGDDRLTFLGHSYGTLLGLTYADLFASHVRAEVLDGVIDPSLSLADMSEAQAEGFDARLTAFFEWCRGAASCAWRPAGDAAAALGSLLSAVSAAPLPAGRGRRLGAGEAYIGILSTLYAQSFWPALGSALAAASAGDGGPLVALFDGYEHHGSTNAADANSAVTCLDHPADSDPATYPAAAARAAQTAPFYGPVFAWGALSCGVWPVRATRTPHAVSAAGSPPILVVGTSADPATPFAWAKAVARHLAHGVLVERVGPDHVAYYYSACVRAIDEAYLLTASTPPTGTICRS